MTYKVWIGDPIPLQFAGGSFYDPFAWTPIGAPTPGDVLTIQDGSPQVIVKEGYVDIWRKNEKGEWKLWMYMSNSDVPRQLPTGA